MGLYPEKFGVVRENLTEGAFANNDLVHRDPTGADHDRFSFGLKKSLLNYMYGICFEYPLQDWFDFKVPRTKVAANYIETALHEAHFWQLLKPTAKIAWLGMAPSVSYFTKTKKGQSWEMATLSFHTKKETFEIKFDKAQGDWLAGILTDIAPASGKLWTFLEVQAHYETAGLEGFEAFWYGKGMTQLKEKELLAV